MCLAEMQRDFVWASSSADHGSGTRQEDARTDREGRLPHAPSTSPMSDARQTRLTFGIRVPD
jgi:hypothetical protein